MCKIISVLTCVIKDYIYAYTYAYPLYTSAKFIIYCLIRSLISLTLLTAHTLDFSETVQYFFTKLENNNNANQTETTCAVLFY